MTLNFENGPIATNGVFFFLGIIGLSSYLGQWSSIVSIVSLLLCCYSLLLTFFKSYKSVQRAIASIFCLALIILAYKNPLCLAAISSLFYFYLSQKSLCETVFWKASCALVTLTVAIDIMAYWGLPGTIVLIWFWSVPLIFLLMLLSLVFHRNKLFISSLCLFCAASVLIHQVAITTYDKESIAVVSDSEDHSSVGMRPNLLRNITEHGSLKTETEARNIISKSTKANKWLISLVATPSLRPEWLIQNAVAGEYFLFAEHDNLTSFIGEDSPFNNDSFRRKSPWDTYKPVMSSLILKEATKDLLYCSNIGCTLKIDLVSYPLIWDYTPSGAPIVLAKGLFEKGKRFTFVGDSDPTADFLAPYNPFWLRGLIGMPNRYDIANACSLILLALLILMGSQNTFRLSALIGIATVLYLGQTIRQDISPQVDVSVTSTERWLSPHYASHFSSLPKKLVQENLTVSIERAKANSLLAIKIITKSRAKIPDKDASGQTKLTLLILMPGASVVTNEGTVVSAGVNPIGLRKVKIHNKKLLVEDARNLVVGNNVSEDIVCFRTDCYVIATGSPQKLGNIGDLISR